MTIIISKDDKELGRKAAKYVQKLLNKAIDIKGSARLLLSTGQSQLSTINELIEMNVEWSKVEVFHLDEYIDLPESHPASFRKYIKERIVDKVNLKAVHYVGEGDIEENILNLTKEIRKEPIDVALIGIGENAHIAFNDPPADFETKEAFIKVKLDDDCKNQQVREGWFPTIDDVPKEALTMTVHQIMESKHIISVVPYKVKAEAIKKSLENELNNEIPATMLKTHNSWTLFLDEESASLIDINSY